MYLFFTTIPPSRTQNISLLVLEKDVTDQEVQKMVQDFNSGKVTRERVTGVFFSVFHHSFFYFLFFSFFLTSQEKINGSYKVVWTDYKTVAKFHIQKRLFQNFQAIKAFDLYLRFREKGMNNIFLQKYDGTPLYTV